MGKARSFLVLIFCLLLLGGVEAKNWNWPSNVPLPDVLFPAGRQLIIRLIENIYGLSLTGVYGRDQLHNTIVYRTDDKTKIAITYEGDRVKKVEYRNIKITIEEILSFLRKRCTKISRSVISEGGGICIEGTDKKYCWQVMSVPPPVGKKWFEAPVQSITASEVGDR